MDKLSLYNLLAILLPGSLFTFICHLFIKDYKINLIDFGLDHDYYKLTLFLSVSLFAGAITHILIMSLLNSKKFNLFKALGMYNNVWEIYKHTKSLAFTQDFFKERCAKHFNNKNKVCSKKQYNTFYDWMYYTLEVDNHIQVPKSFQSFYFFFRNFFTMSLLLLIPAIISLFIQEFALKYWLILVFLLTTIFFSRIAAIWYRKKMVSKMYWSFYALNNKI